MVQFVSDELGQAMAVVIPIEEWYQIRNKYPDIESLEGDLPQWQKDIIDKNLLEIKLHPERLRPIDELFAELDKED
jgi:hypothetical protein